jgi:hypothetical protein
LLQAGRASRDMLSDEPANRLIAYRGKDGSVVWDKSVGYQGPCMLHGKMIITQSSALDLLTGKPAQRVNPLTGELMRWRYQRHYGCNTVVASRHLLTFRSAAAGFLDLVGLGGTANLGGFRSGCSSNLVVANGVLNAPDYTHSCTCSYQNQCSLAFVHMPENEMWSFNDFKVAGKPIKRVGINLGAPGDRVASNGVLWLEYPTVGGPSPLVPIEHMPEKPGWFCRHAMQVEGEYAWVAASGPQVLSSLRVGLAKKTARRRTYTVRLFFCEPANVEPGQRVFSVAIQGKPVLTDFDIVKEARGRLRSVIKAFKGIIVEDELAITLTPSDNAKLREPILCGVEATIEE